MSIFKRKTITPNRRVEMPLYLNNALICVDCLHIYPSSSLHRCCPKCASEQTIPLSKWVPVPGKSYRTYMHEVM